VNLREQNRGGTVGGGQEELFGVGGVGWDKVTEAPSMCSPDAAFPSNEISVAFLDTPDLCIASLLNVREDAEARLPTTTRAMEARVPVRTMFVTGLHD